MVEFFEEMKPSQETWIKKQKLFFVASAPLTGKGTVNCSPKGYDSLRIINSKQVCYLELSGISTSPFSPLFVIDIFVRPEATSPAIAKAAQTKSLA